MDLHVPRRRVHLPHVLREEELHPEGLGVRLQRLGERAVVHARVRLRQDRARAADVRLPLTHLPAVEHLDLARGHPVLQGPRAVRVQGLELRLLQRDLVRPDLRPREALLRGVPFPEAVRDLCGAGEHPPLLRVEVERPVDDARVPAARVLRYRLLLLEDDEAAGVPGREPVRDGGA